MNIADEGWAPLGIPAFVTPEIQSERISAAEAVLCILQSYDPNRDFESATRTFISRWKFDPRSEDLTEENRSWIVEQVIAADPRTKFADCAALTEVCGRDKIQERLLVDLSQYEQHQKYGSMLWSKASQQLLQWMVDKKIEGEGQAGDYDKDSYQSKFRPIPPTLLSEQTSFVEVHYQEGESLRTEFLLVNNFVDIFDGRAGKHNEKRPSWRLVRFWRAHILRLLSEKGGRDCTLREVLPNNDSVPADATSSTNSAAKMASSVCMSQATKRPTEILRRKQTTGPKPRVREAIVALMMENYADSYARLDNETVEILLSIYGPPTAQYRKAHQKLSPATVKDARDRALEQLRAITGGTPT